MHRHYFISNDLDDLKAVEDAFYDNGFSKAQLHVLTEKESEVMKYKLHELDSISKSDVVHGGFIGAAIGIAIALGIVGFGGFSGAVDLAGWAPYLFLAAVAFLFCVWEGGLFGIQVRNVEFRRFDEVLKNGKHVLMVDISEDQRDALNCVIGRHPKLVHAGIGAARPTWLIYGQKNFNSIVETLP